MNEELDRLKQKIEWLCETDRQALCAPLLRTGADHGDLECALMLREGALEGKYGIEKDKELALAYTKDAARLGDARCMYHVAVVDYALGNYDDAWAWMREAYVRDIPEASFALARMSAYGQGTSQDLHQASLYMQEAKDCDAEPDQRPQLDEWIQEHLALEDYSKGRIQAAISRLTKVESVRSCKFLAVIDPDNRMRYLRQAAALDDPEAEYLTGLLETDPKMRFRRLKNAAKQGWVPAYARLARCYRLGLGVSVNQAEAARWQKEAEKNTGKS